MAPPTTDLHITALRITARRTTVAALMVDMPVQRQPLVVSMLGRSMASTKSITRSTEVEAVEAHLAAARTRIKRMSDMQGL
jgi:hypothetical protein